MSKIHKPSLLLGVGLVLILAVVAGLTATTASAFSWPWSPKPKPQVTETVEGFVSCSSGYNYSSYPVSLTLTANGTSRTINYSAPIQQKAAIYPLPKYEYYRLKVTIPTGADNTTVNWSLSCNNPAIGSEGAVSKSFTVGRANTKRTICSYGGVYPFTPCQDPGKAEATGACVVGIFTDAVGSEVLSWSAIAADADADTLTKFLDAVHLANPVLGLVLTCARAIADQQPAPPQLTTVAPMPTPTITPLAPLTTVPPAPAPRTTAAPPPVLTSAAAPRSTAAASQPAAPPDRTAITSYDQMRGGAPYWGRATKGWQAFTAASNTLTVVGVTWSDTHYQSGGTLYGITTRISLCQGVGSGADPCIGRIADGSATVVNQGDTRIDFGDVAVTPGATYYVFYYQPQVDAGSWDFYWWSCACPPGRQSSLLSDQNQLVVQGYNR